MLASFLDAVPDFAAEPVRVVAEDDWFAISFVLTGANTGPFTRTPGPSTALPPPADPGKLADHWGLVDLATLFAQLQS
ncbi:hypothetical protein [Streptomyces sp. NPDC058307]|uniref:hypothetical protein n=1 Tax=Streptomyces sp. NPDC058307 TaxID=3346439 RepID=UPI0036ED70B1